jgi:hypothetical protein
MMDATMTTRQRVTHAPVARVLLSAAVIFGLLVVLLIL